MIELHNNTIELHHTNYFLISFDKSLDLVHYSFYKTTSTMTKEEYILELKAFIDVVKKYQPAFVLGNMVDFGFIITPDIQTWINENLFSVYAQIGLKKIALLLSNELFSQVSIQQTIEEDENAPFSVAYFENEQEAIAWFTE